MMHRWRKELPVQDAAMGIDKGKLFASIQASTVWLRSYEPKENATSYLLTWSRASPAPLISAPDSQTTKYCPESASEHEKTQSAIHFHI